MPIVGHDETRQVGEPHGRAAFCDHAARAQFAFEKNHGAAVVPPNAVLRAPVRAAPSVDRVIGRIEVDRGRDVFVGGWTAGVGIGRKQGTRPFAQT